MRGAVDAAGEPGGDDEARAAELGCEHAASFWPAAEAWRADDGDDRARQVGGVALDVEERRRRIDGGKGGG